MLMHIGSQSDVSTSAASHSGTIAIVLTCHGQYLQYLQAAVESIDRQIPQPEEKVAVFDGCAAPQWLRARPSWRIIQGNWANPNPARNVGLRQTRAEWIIWFDADDIMPDGYIAAMRQAISTVPRTVGIIYPDLYYVDQTLRLLYSRPMPEYDYWRLRRGNYIDTSSAWRRQAVEQAGGWDEDLPVLQDYTLALRITRLGWHGKKLQAPAVLKRRHGENRLQWEKEQQGLWREVLWQVRSMAVVTLHAGRWACLDEWIEWLRTAELPPERALYVVDNSGSREFGAALRRLIWDELEGWRHIDIATVGSIYKPRPGERYDDLRRHAHVANLYAGVLPRVAEDVVLLLEDDVVPPVDAARRLHRYFGPDSDVAAVGAAYPSPTCPQMACAARGRDYWHDMPRWDELGQRASEVGFVSGGCTLWANWALRECLPTYADLEDGKLWGWETHLCREARERGYRILLDEGVRCRHRIRAEGGKAVV